MTTVGESRVIHNLLTDHLLFKHLKLPAEFPVSPPNFETHLRLARQPLENELGGFASRISKNSQKIVWAIDAFDVLNSYLQSDDLINAMSVAEEIEKKVGCSFVLLIKLVYIFTRMTSGSVEKNICAKWLSRYGLSANNVVALSLADTMGEIYSLFSVRKNILGIEEKVGQRRFTVDLAKFVQLPLADNQNEFHNILQSFGQSSLIDAVFYLSLHRYNLEGSSVFEISDELGAEIDSVLADPWARISRGSFDFNELADQSCEHHDTAFYRQSIAWIELADVTKHRKLFDYYYRDQEEQRDLLDESIAGLAETYFGGSIDVEKLLVFEAPEVIDLNRFDQVHSGIFSRTIAFIRHLEESEGELYLTPDEFMRLMSLTRDVADIASRVYLAKFAKVNTDEVTQFVVNCLIARRSQRGVDTFKLRRTLEAIVLRRFEGNLLQFIIYLNDRSSAVADFVYELCDEAFLSQLFRLFPETDDFYECRADLHEWYGDKHEEPVYLERAKTLRIDLRLQKIRGEIDDTRIYVDPNRYFEWLQDNLFTELSGVLRSQRMDQLSLILNEPNTDLVAQQSPEVRMAALFAKAFEEFYVNTKFGISSYLGRRIRHGTLRGMMLSPVQALIESSEFLDKELFPDSARFLTNWLGVFEQGVEKLGSDYLQIHGNRKSKGLFGSDIFRQDRALILKAAIREVDKTFSETDSFPHVNSLIYSYCWRFADADLKKVREHLGNCRQEWGTLNTSEFRRTVPSELRARSNSFTRELGTLLDERFRTITSWFNEPKNLSPSAPLGLLFQAVLSEVIESFADFRPNIIADEGNEINLTGGAYHLIYDALYVVVHNAAKHGKSDGDLVCKFSMVPQSNGEKELHVEITSEALEYSTDQEIEQSICDAMKGNHDDALAMEGRSGFKKLLRMQNDSREMIRFSSNCEGGRVSVLCVYRLIY